MSSLMAGSHTLIGQIKLRYRIVATLDGEGMGVVYKAQHTALNRFVALKFSRRPRERRAGLARVRREAKAVSASSHPNICTIYQTGDHDGRCFIAMESMEGKTKTMSFSRHWDWKRSDRGD